MNAQSQKVFLRIQLIEIQRLIELVGDHPVMSVALTERAQEMREQLDALSSDDLDRASNGI